MRGWRPIHLAVESGDIEMVRTLLELGAQTDVAFQGELPVDIANKQGNQEIAKILGASGN